MVWIVGGLRRDMHMKYVDAHIHLSDEEYASCVDEVIAEAKTANVVATVSNSVDLKTSKGNLALVERYPGLVYVALGIHPWNVQMLTDKELEETIKFIREQQGNEGVVAIGEIGLDSKYMPIWDRQMMVFDRMLHLAEELDLPTVVHSRGVTEQIIDMLPSYSVKNVLLHWFSNPISALPRAIDKGYYITEGPTAVYSDGIQDVVRKVPLDKLMTETDGPVRYFRPPFKGAKTTPAFIPTVVKTVAELKGMDGVDVAKQMATNFERFFAVKLN